MSIKKLIKCLKNGFTFYVCFGKWAGFQLRHGFAYGIVLGFISVMVIPTDIENLLYKMTKEILDLAGQNSHREG